MSEVTVREVKMACDEKVGDVKLVHVYYDKQAEKVLRT